MSVFVFDQTRASRDQICMAQNAVKKLRTLRYPYILKFIETVEHHGSLYLVVDHVIPLSEALATWKQKRNTYISAWIAWGISHIANAIAFLHEQTQCVHGNVHPGSIFLSLSGEWLLGGMDLLSNPKENDALVSRLGSALPTSSTYAPPELLSSGWSAMSSLPISSTDSYSFALVTIECFNGSIPRSMEHFAAGKIPPSLYVLLKKLTQPKPDMRMTMAEFVQASLHPKGFLASNVFVEASMLLDSFRVSSEEDKAGILARLLEIQDQLAPCFSEYKVLPALIETFRYKPTSQPAELVLSGKVILPAMLRIGNNMDTVAWNNVLREAVVGAFGSNDRGICMELLTNASLYEKHLDSKLISSQMWPLVVKSMHTAYDPQRAAALNCTVLLLNKLNDRILNNDLLRELAKLQKDVQPALRLQTIQLLSQLTPYLRDATKADMLIPAFGFSLRDNFDQTRLAGLSAFFENAESFDAQTSAKKVLPSISPCLVDENADVRAKASETLHMYLDKIATYTAGLDSVSNEIPDIEQERDTDLSIQAPVPKPASKSGLSAFLTATAGSAASALSDWAMAQIEDDELAERVDQGIQSEPRPHPEHPDTPLMSPSPAVPMHGNRSAMTLGSKESTDQPSHLFTRQQEVVKQKIVPKLHTTKPLPLSKPQQPKPVQTQPIPKQSPAPASNTSTPTVNNKPLVATATMPAPAVPAKAPTTSDTSTLSKEEKMAQLQKLREERKAVRIIRS